jgi:OOP family OmpA-OmpF porin
VYRTFALAVCVAAALPVAAQAANHGFYASIDGGVVAQKLSGPFTALPLGGLLALDTLPKPDQSPDLGWALFGAAGMRFDGPFRAEAEIGYRASTLSSASDVDHLTVMANLLYDFPLGKGFALSIGGGIGMDRISWTGQGLSPLAGFCCVLTSDNAWRFAVQGLVGASYKVSDHVAIDLKYRYMVPTGANLLGLLAIRNGLGYEFTATDVLTHTISLGLTFDLD